MSEWNGVYACCGHRGCDWSQAVPALNDAWYVIYRHEQEAHGETPRTVAYCSAGPWTIPKFRPSAIDYMLAYPQFFAWRGELPVQPAAGKEPTP